MQAELEERLQQLGCDDDSVRRLIEESCRDAQRLMSPRGMEHYLLGIEAMQSLGKGQDLILTCVQEMPEVVREVGEDILPDIIESLMKLSSLTSGAVLCLVTANLPLAASRLGDAELLRGYLKLLHQVAGKAPRGLRPMQQNLAELLSRLTLGGLRRWALWGAQAYARDFDGQQVYFSLESETSRSILRSERRGTLFVDNHRKLNFYLRALWGRVFLMRPTSGDFENRKGLRPTIENFQILLPDAFDACADIEGIDVYRAAAAHAAAHIVHSRQRLCERVITKKQRCFIDLFEDARIEYLTYREFPGLRRLWLRFFEIALDSADRPKHHAVELMLRLGRRLLNPACSEDSNWLAEIADEFNARLAADPGEQALSVQFGIRFYEMVETRACIPAPHILRDLPIAYRDDNSYSWNYDESDGGADSETLMWLQPTRRKKVSLMEMVNEIDSELEDGSPQELWVLPTELFPYEDNGRSYNQLEGVESISAPFHYEEWDYQVQLARPEWTTLTERRQGLGDPASMHDILQKHRPIANRIKQLIDALQPQGITRQRRCEDGDELDIDAAVHAMVDSRRGIMPDPRVNIRVTRHLRDLSMLVLVDLSASTNKRIGGLGELDEGYTDQPRILDLTREATALLSWAVDAIGDNFAVDGFASDGRHDVQYYRFKDFDESCNETVRARLAGMQGGLSTRMGAALRHAGWRLARQPGRKRLILLITDGEPADIDERDPRYLRQDTKHAVAELAAQEIHTYCLTLDPDADSYVSRIFGANNFSIVDNIERLPERLTRVFSVLTT